jgi:uncharacterized protein (TIGR00299 family) protein
MTVGALLDAGGARVDIERLRSALAMLSLPELCIACEQVEVNGVRAASFKVSIDAPSHAHRDWHAIRAMISKAGARGLAPGVVERSIAIFGALAEAEARVHRVDPDHVHFHEVGAVDSIVDIVSTAWCLDELEIEQCFVGPLPSGSGSVATEHGRLPVPAPATVELLRGFDIVAGDGEGELVTPTGAAILCALAKPMRPAFRLEAAGTGAGTRRLRDRPNVLRVLIGECEARADDNVAIIEADIDDMTPSALAHVADRLRGSGARDVTLIPALMKKGRSGTRLTVVCDMETLRPLANVVLSESSTIGVRYRAYNRIVLPRRIEVVNTEYGPIALKIVQRPDGKETAEPEHDDLARAALACDKPLKDVRAAALAAWERSRKD